jgi:thioredoxin-dependent peroxiredoxin
LNHARRRYDGCMGTLSPGDEAPSFSLRDQSGHEISLASFAGRKVLVYFYPRADTPGCTTQSCAVRDAREDFASIGVDVVGISPDEPSDQAAFDEKYTLGFPLLSDPDHRVAEAWGVWGEKSLYGKRYTGLIRSSFLVDERGRIEQAWYKVAPKQTIPKALAALASA